ncbi:hypothetical protein CDD82_5290 [Ophiocordyceps australis]|uniref:Elongator complex protein 6 n=1 Tax=Ophiocordyceps australis TaxID=1399860 RepID=A0A2C5ZT94_9HYPO|nr:hypothetical protein CDD82_5290 [Ophiocordyceps australis]
MSAPRIPPLLEPYLAPLPRGALVLLTSVLGARANWLVVRFIYAVLRQRVDDEGQSLRNDGHDGGTPGVVLLSFMRDEAFWLDAASKMGLDLHHLARRGAFVFVPGLTGLFAPTAPPGSDALGSLGAAVNVALAQLSASQPILIIDQPDVLLAARGNAMTARRLHDSLLTLRQRVHAALIVLSADHPLIHSRATSLERHHAALALSLAHAAHTVMALRPLDTGAAPDVSGVLRLSTRLDHLDYAYDGQLQHHGPHKSLQQTLPSAEFLYHVAGDATVRVFERGA